MAKVPSSTTAMEGLAGALLEEAQAGLVGYVPTPLSLLDWSAENRQFKGKPFSLAGHEYLRELYVNPFQGYRYCVLEKAAQMGATEFALTLALWFSDHYPRTRTLYLMPSDELINDFSADRVDPVIQASPRLLKIVRGIDNRGLKQVGHSSLYLRGMYAKAKVKSVPGDMVVFDELDEAKPANKAQAIERLSHSDFRWVLELSTPTLPGYGIDQQWGNTDQRYWHLACGCHDGCVLEDTFPECIGQRNGEFFLRCPRCGKEKLDPCEPAVVGEYRGWIPKDPSAEKRGYHITQLFSTVVPLKEIWQAWESGRDREEFYNSKLGMPYAGDRMPLTDKVLRGCEAQGYHLEPKRTNPKERFFIGADQGIEVHIVVTKELANGKRQTVWLERCAFREGNDPFERLAKLIKQLSPVCTVIDAMPNIGPARNLCEAFKKSPTPVYMCHYNENQKGLQKWKKAERQVIAQRTDTLNEMVGDWIHQVYVVPEGEPEVQVAFSHLKSLAKVIQTDDETGVQREVYIHIGQDHFAHAFNYEAMAARYPFGRSHVDFL